MAHVLARMTNAEMGRRHGSRHVVLQSSKPAVKECRPDRPAFEQRVSWSTRPCAVWAIGGASNVCLRERWAALENQGAETSTLRSEKVAFMQVGVTLESADAQQQRVIQPAPEGAVLLHTGEVAMLLFCGPLGLNPVTAWS